MTSYPSIGRHLLATLEGCDADLLNDPAFLINSIEQAATATGATVLHTASHHFTPHGVTVVVLLAESHASLHTYPEDRRAFWDCFTCGSTCDPTRSLPILIAALGATTVHQQTIERG